MAHTWDEPRDRFCKCVSAVPTKANSHTAENIIFWGPGEGHPYLCALGESNPQTGNRSVVSGNASGCHGAMGGLSYEEGAEGRDDVLLKPESGEYSSFFKDSNVHQSQQQRHH